MYLHVNRRNCNEAVRGDALWFRSPCMTRHIYQASAVGQRRLPQIGRWTPALPFSCCITPYISTIHFHTCRPITLHLWQHIATQCRLYACAVCISQTDHIHYVLHYNPRASFYLPLTLTLGKPQTHG